MKRAIVLGGNGVLGRAIALRLAAAGWATEVTGRDPSRFPSELSRAGVRFRRSDRRDAGELAEVIGRGADLLVDARCYTAADARMLLPHLGDIRSTVMLSSKAVYVDRDGNHVNSDIPPRFEEPIREDAPTMQPGDGEYRSRDGYGANKVAAELVLLESGRPVTVIRASKVHGAGAANPREWMFVKRVLDGRRVVLLARGGRGGDHTTAAANTAALVETVAANPGARILNSADPDAPTGLEIARAVAGPLGHEWREVLLPDDADPALGAHPWDFVPPIVLDTTASAALGYRPVGTFAKTVGAEIDWLVASKANRPAASDEYFEHLTDYTREDRFLAG
ncbi:NAD-dependent epimerase/dehydratase family protein [Diaminobutyricibacter sp. McL0608]|uniref:NAD-dependent epimerase/dehydratase family protein n=1 Tax=Leifsonia sp. McL0608 TaxID=3143537 RepID=UPI0031F31E9F